MQDVPTGHRSRAEMGRNFAALLGECHVGHAAAQTVYVFT
jgi:hypothetical protein